jgi:hypothetical protein
MNVGEHKEKEIIEKQTIMNITSLIREFPVGTSPTVKFAIARLYL